MLSPREKECISHLLCGLPDKEIAKRMSIAPRTVKCMLSKIALRLQICSSLHKRIAIAVTAHENRHLLGVYCPCCDDIR